MKKQKDRLTTFNDLNNYINKQNQINDTMYLILDKFFNSYNRLPTKKELAMYSKRTPDKKIKKGMYWISVIGFELCVYEWQLERGYINE